MIYSGGNCESPPFDTEALIEDMERDFRQSSRMLKETALFLTRGRLMISTMSAWTCKRQSFSLSMSLANPDNENKGVGFQTKPTPFNLNTRKTF